jgi:hypothetical protein
MARIRMGQEPGAGLEKGPATGHEAGSHRVRIAKAKSAAKT